MPEKQELDVTGFGLAFGIVYGLLLLVIGWSAWLTGFGSEYVALASSLMPGFGASLVGGIAGGIAGAVLGIVMGALIAGMYNWYVRR